jgi:hypothetical protein
MLHARFVPTMKQTQARCGPKHGPCRRFGGAVRADEPPPPQAATRLGKAARQQTAASHVPPAWSRSPSRSTPRWGDMRLRLTIHLASLVPQMVGSRRRHPHR